EFWRGQLVLDVENGLAVGRRPGLQPRRREVALPVLPALLVNREVEVRLQVADLSEVVLEPDREPRRVSEVGDLGVELLLVRAAVLNSVFVRLAFDMSDLARSTPRRPRLRQPCGELVKNELLSGFRLPGVRVRSRHVGVDFQPELVSEPADRLAEQASAAA